VQTCLRRSIARTCSHCPLKPMSLPAKFDLGSTRPRCAGLSYRGGSLLVYHCWYCVPFSLIRQVVDARITHRTVEVFHRGTRVASYPRQSHAPVTCASHMRDPGRRSHITAISL
jgi:hypothetical protein